MVKGLEEEIQFLKRHYDIELNLLREQYQTPASESVVQKLNLEIRQRDQAIADKD